MNSKRYSICVVGGTGAEGGGLGLRWAKDGHRVTITSHDETRAKTAAAELSARLALQNVKGAEISNGVQSADIVVLTVPYSAQLPTVCGLNDALQGKILVDVTVPLVPPKVSRVQLPEQILACWAVQALLGEGVRVVSAFHNVSAHKLKHPDYRIDCDVFIASDDKEARATVIQLASDAGLRGIDVGPLANSVVSESLTSALIWSNKHYKIPDAGIRITALPRE